MSATDVWSEKSGVRFPEQARGWKIVHVDISRVGSLELEPGYEGLYLGLWHEDRPLGHCELAASELPLSQTQAREMALRTIAPAIASYTGQGDANRLSEVNRTGAELVPRLEDPWQSRAAPDEQSVSVVVCTRDRPQQLERCLRSIQGLRYQPSEIIVVDNGNRREETARVVRQFEKTRYIVESVAGLSHARNAGVRAARNPLIAFTDDDIVVSPNWLFHLTQALNDQRVAAASGLVFPAELRTKAQILFERGFGGFNQGYEPRLAGPEFIAAAGHRAAPVWRICAGGNMIVRGKTFDRVGPFDARLGAGASGCSEDSEFWYRILAGGGNCAYVPAAVVYHYHREDMNSLRRQIFMYMRGHVAALLAQFGRFRHWGNLHRLLIELPLYYTMLLLRCVLRGERQNLILLAGARGSAAGVWYWMRHRSEM